MQSRSFFRAWIGPIGLLAAGLVVAPPLRGAGEERPPNVVLILADDLGWSDTTIHGTTKFYQTPNLQRLADRGMIFTRAYAASPLCSPTRASILTGQSPARVGITDPVCHLPAVQLKPRALDKDLPQRKAALVKSATRLDTRHFTLAEALKEAGYATAHFGKWHLGPEPYSPLQHGFETDLPHWPGPGPGNWYLAPWVYPDFKPRKPREHIEDRMADEAVAFIERHKDRPFFLNFWQFSVHGPWEGKPGLVAKYRALADPANPQRCPTYAAMVESLDDAVGKLLDALYRHQLADNTIVIFTSDNGGNMYVEVDGTVPTSNAPLRGGKATIYEGGIRVPWIVRWPGVTAAGTRCDTIVQSTDIYPTLLGMLGIKERAEQVFDGASIVPLLEGKTSEALSTRPVFTYFPHAPEVPDWLPPSAAVHHGDWKLIRLFHEGRAGAHAYRLYDLGKDPGETRNLAGEMPDKVRELDAMIEKFLNDTGAVRPRRNPAFDPQQYQPGRIGVGKLKPQKKRQGG